MMDIAPPSPEPGRSAARLDRDRIRYAVLGAASLLLGIWLVWLGCWLLGWSLDDLGIEPRQLHGMIGILTAPLAHASFEQLFARESVHVGMSGVNHGLMFFLFLSGLWRRDRLGIAISLVVFFFYGSMVLTVLPREEHVSFEYHLAGALAGALCSLLLFRLDPKPVPKRYQWEDEEDEEHVEDDEWELPRPHEVPVLWQRDDPGVETARILEFPPRSPETGKPRTLH